MLCLSYLTSVAGEMFAVELQYLGTELRKNNSDYKIYKWENMVRYKIKDWVYIGAVVSE